MCVCLFVLCVFVDKLKVDTQAEKVQSKRNIWNGMEWGWAQSLTPFTVSAAKGEHGGQNPGGQTDIPVRYHILERWAQRLAYCICYLLFDLHPQHLNPTPFCFSKYDTQSSEEASPRPETAAGAVCQHRGEILRRGPWTGEEICCPLSPTLWEGSF